MKHGADISPSGTKDVFSYTASSQTIWGGNGDRDEDCLILLTNEGWKKKTVITETGTYQKGDGCISTDIEMISEEALEKIINGDLVGFFQVRAITDFFTSLKEKYPLEFSASDVGIFL